ncbi:MAG: methyltransferase domain-containing protein [Gammaproteobacteria bacterium]
MPARPGGEAPGQRWRVVAPVYPENRLAHNWLAKRILNDKVRARLRDFRGKVLDLGCGSRPFEQDILQHAQQYVGVDWAHTLHGLQADIVADLGRPLPLPDAGYDHVVSLEVLEHLAEPDIMLGEAWRVLRPGGQVTLSVPFQWWVHEAPRDYCCYTRHGFEYRLRKARFFDIRVEAMAGFWVMWILKLNYQLAKLVRGSPLRRRAVHALLLPFWYVGQRVAPMLDRAWPDENETAGYFVTARKP